MNRPPPRTDGERGSATVEFALVFPAFLGVLALVIGAGWLGVVQASLDRGAREGARYAAIGDGWTYPDPTDVAAAVDRATPLVDPSQVTVTASGDDRQARVRVEVTRDVANPVAWLFAPLELVGVDSPVSATITMTADADARRE